MDVAHARHRRFRKYIPRWILTIRTAFLATRNLLKQQGLYRTIATGRPIARDGTPIPWFTYGAIAYLDQFDFSTLDVFEYGSGNSTLFWQACARRVVSVEDDPTWFAEIETQIDRSRVDYRLVPASEDYVSAVSGRTYDIIVIDGSHREECVAPAIRSLNAGGFIILDNADWFPGPSAELRAAGLLEIDFTGFGPINSYTSTTSMFIRREAELAPLGAQPRVGLGGMPENVRPLSGTGSS